MTCVGRLRRARSSIDLGRPDAIAKAMIARILIGLYLAFGVFAVAGVIIDPSDDPLSAVFLAMAAMPWTLALSSHRYPHLRAPRFALGTGGWTQDR